MQRLPPLLIGLALGALGAWGWSSLALSPAPASAPARAEVAQPTRGRTDASPASRDASHAGAEARLHPPAELEDPSLSQAAVLRSLADVEARLAAIEKQLAALGRRPVAAAAGDDLRPLVASILDERRALETERKAEREAQAYEEHRAVRAFEVRAKALQVGRDLGMNEHQSDLFAEALAAFEDTNVQMRQNYGQPGYGPDEWVRMQSEARDTFEARLRQDVGDAFADRILEMWF